MIESFKDLRITFYGPVEYEIIVEGPLDEGLSDQLAGMSIASTERQDKTWVTTLKGQIADQAELLGILSSLFDLHRSILSVWAVK